MQSCYSSLLEEVPAKFLIYNLILYMEGGREMHAAHGLGTRLLFAYLKSCKGNFFCLETWPWLLSTSVLIGDQSHLQAPSNMCSFPFLKSPFYTGLCGRLPLGLTKRRCPRSDGRDLCRDRCALFGFAEGMSEVECGVGTFELNSDHMVLGRVSLGS